MSCASKDHLFPSWSVISSGRYIGMVLFYTNSSLDQRFFRETMEENVSIKVVKKPHLSLYLPIPGAFCLD